MSTKTEMECCIKEVVNCNINIAVVQGTLVVIQSVAMMCPGCLGVCVIATQVRMVANASAKLDRVNEGVI